MLVISTIEDFLRNRNHLSGSVGFVPTMGSLHNGHIELVRRSKSANKHTAVSIFVNPTQFGPNEDYGKYPKNIEKDIDILERENVDILFCPELKEMYPDKSIIKICIDSRFNRILCGKYRKNHFAGVATVVLKLINIVKPTECFLGLKDYQQYMLIKTMTQDLNLDLRITGVETIRDTDGLALSSRNQYLSPENRKIADGIYKTLINTASYYAYNKNISRSNLKIFFQNELLNRSSEFIVQYFNIYNRNLKSIRHYEPGNMFMGTAVYLGKTRLIDNILF